LEHRLLNRTAFWSLPVFYYALMALGIIIAPLVGGISLPYASPANYTGTPAALEASMSLVAIFVMGSPVVFALGRLFLDRTQAIPEKTLPFGQPHSKERLRIDTA
jgi:hypothetical protein